MDFLFIVSSDFCLLAHTQSQIPNLSSSLSLSCEGLEKASPTSRRSGGTGRRCRAPTLEPGKRPAVCASVYVCVRAGKRVYVEPDLTHHSQPTDLTRYRGNFPRSRCATPHTRQTHVGEIMVCLQPGLIPT